MINTITLRIQTALGLPRWLSIADRTQTAIDAGGAVAILLIYMLYSPTMPLWVGGVGVALLSTAFFLHPTARPWYVTASTIALMALWSIGAFGAARWGYGESTMSLTLAMGSLLLYMVIHTQFSERFLGWLAAGTYVHAFIAIGQGFQHFRDPLYRATGITANPDPAGGLLGFAIIYLIATRRWYLTAPLFLALHLTATRLAFWCVLGFVVVLCIRRCIPWQGLVTIGVTLAIATWFFWPQAARLYFIDNQSPAEVVERQIELRLHAPSQPTADTQHSSLLTLASQWLPRGYAGDIGAHATPIRLYWEIGIGGIVAIAFLSWVGFRNASATQRLLLALLLAFSSLDYYVIMVPGLLIVGSLIAIGIRGERCSI